MMYILNNIFDSAAASNVLFLSHSFGFHVPKHFKKNLKQDPLITNLNLINSIQILCILHFKCSQFSV